MSSQDSKVTLHKLYLKLCDRDNRFIDDVLGKVLTVIDATFSDKQQRDAFKSLVRNSVYVSATNHTKDFQEILEQFGYLKGLDVEWATDIRVPREPQVNWFSDEQ
jgi:hypothetical protein